MSTYSEVLGSKFSWFLQSALRLPFASRFRGEPDHGLIAQNAGQKIESYERFYCKETGQLTYHSTSAAQPMVLRREAGADSGLFEEQLGWTNFFGKAVQEVGPQLMKAALSRLSGPVWEESGDESEYSDSEEDHSDGSDSEEEWSEASDSEGDHSCSEHSEDEWSEASDSEGDYSCSDYSEEDWSEASDSEGDYSCSEHSDSQKDCQDSTQDNIQSNRHEGLRKNLHRELLKKTDKTASIKQRSVQKKQRPMPPVKASRENMHKELLQRRQKAAQIENCREEPQKSRPVARSNSSALKKKRPHKLFARKEPLGSSLQSWGANLRAKLSAAVAKRAEKKRNKKKTKNKLKPEEKPDQSNSPSFLLKKRRQMMYPDSGEEDTDSWSD